MRIKKIKRTNQYKHIDFRCIKEDWQSAEVYTPNGWAKVKAFEYIRRGPSKVIMTQGFKLICDPKHVVQAFDGDMLCAITADQLDDNKHKLVGYNNIKRDFEITDGDVEDFYDIEIDSPHWWYTSGIVSHNSIVLCNNAITSLKGSGPGGVPGQDVLLITFELDTIKTAMRCLGVMAQEVPLDAMMDRKEYVTRIVTQVQRTYNKRFLIVEWPPDECSVSHIYALLDNLRRTDGWHPDVIILDYLDLMNSRNDAYNKDDYTRQKHVANEIRGLAKNENVLVFTATQTNRTATQTNRTATGGGEGFADLSKAAESFAKQFSLDYVVSLNQSHNERRATPPRMTMFIAKNRNGPKNETVDCTITYETMVVREQP